MPRPLAKALPLFGQQAVRTVLNELSRAGHLRRVRRRAEGGATGEGGDGLTRWVFRTYWSRTARDSEWWARFLAGDVPSEAQPEAPAEECPTPVPPAALGDVPTREPKQAEQADRPAQGDRGDQGDAPQPAVRPCPSAAYETLARLGRSEPRLTLSATDCVALEELASAWLARGATPAILTQSLVAGLPEQVYSLRALVQRRLRDKMPPELPAPRERTPRAILECTDCGVPGRPEALPDGLCRACRGAEVQSGSRPPSTAVPQPGAETDGPRHSTRALSADDVRRHTTQVRDAFAGRRNLAKRPQGAVE